MKKEWNPVRASGNAGAVTVGEEKKKSGFETRAIHVGQDYQGDTGAVIPPVYLTSTFAQGNPDGFDYTRSGNPNFRNLEKTLASLEGAAHATVFASGVSAITAIVSTLKSGDLVLAEENLYGCTYRLFERVFAKFGVKVEYLDFTRDASLVEIGRRRPELVWIESPTNPLLKVIDIAAVAVAARAAGSVVVVDNTFASSYLQKPVELGAHLSLLSTTKYTSGHSDCLGGAVCTDDESWREKMLFAQKALGLQPSPFDAWLVSRGVKTSAVRMERHCANALALARWLESAGIVTADLGLSLEDTLRFLREMRLFTLAESLGGIESLSCHPATMTHAAIPREAREAVGITDSLVRFSVGIENGDDLIADVAAALKAVKG